MVLTYQVNSFAASLGSDGSNRVNLAHQLYFSLGPFHGRDIANVLRTQPIVPSHSMEVYDVRDTPRAHWQGQRSMMRSIHLEDWLHAASPPLAHNFIT